MSRFKNFFGNNRRRQEPSKEPSFKQRRRSSRQRRQLKERVKRGDTIKFLKISPTPLLPN
jgi:hypothetical protein